MSAGSLDKLNHDFCKVYKKYFEYCIYIYHKMKSITPDFWDEYYKNYRKKVDNSVLKQGTINHFILIIWR